MNTEYSNYIALSSVAVRTREKQKRIINIPTHSSIYLSVNKKNQYKKTPITSQELKHLDVPRLSRPVHQSEPLPVSPLQSSCELVRLGRTQTPDRPQIPGANANKELACDGGLLGEEVRAGKQQATIHKINKHAQDDRTSKTT